MTVQDGNQVYKRVKPKLPSSRKSLAIILMSLQGTEVVIDLKNDMEVKGFVEEADRGMNLTLSNASQVNPDGSIHTASSLTVTGSTIRSVHIPPFIRMESHITNYLRKLDGIKRQAKPHQIKDREKRKVDSLSLARKPAKEIHMSSSNKSNA
eukprot:CAMPEP_0174962620 /NCGR_PEP_ID=MMETSP0004_2-20121128/4879_1 /TAXON_ID=420556 /ORGANISM="Ochromonas sp., Strain CCMP1393" /LENGTH=151 /DNA_ID=CAMNT_0016211161 /DNA_START=41 /DNA_END=496 /DNA_ORIENTATION=-